MVENLHQRDQREGLGGTMPLYPTNTNPIYAVTHFLAYSFVYRASRTRAPRNRLLDESPWTVRMGVTWSLLCSCPPEPLRRVTLLYQVFHYYIELSKLSVWRYIHIALGLEHTLEPTRSNSVLCSVTHRGSSPICHLASV